MSEDDLIKIVGKSLDLFLDKEWKTDLLIYIAVSVFTIGSTILILIPIKVLTGL